VVTGSMAIVFFGLSLLGVLAFAGLLILGLRMWSEEAAAKRAAFSSPPPARPVEAEPVPGLPAEGAQPPEIAAQEPETPAPATEEAAAPLPPEAAVMADPAGPTSAAAGPKTLEAAPATPAAKTAGLFPTLFNRPAAGQEILRVARDIPTGKLMVFVAGKPYANFQDLQDSLIEQDFMSGYSHLQAFAQNAVVKAAPPEPDGTATALVEAAAPPPARVVYHTSELPPLEIPTMRPLQQFQKMRKKKPDAPKIVIKSITEQIEDHLQEKIAGTRLAQRGVHVRAESRGNAVFLLEGKIYATVEEVPDPDAQKAIREAITEWEKST
jgi:hypothetical protein